MDGWRMKEQMINEIMNRLLSHTINSIVDLNEFSSIMWKVYLFSLQTSENNLKP